MTEETVKSAEKAQTSGVAFPGGVMVAHDRLEKRLWISIPTGEWDLPPSDSHEVSLMYGALGAILTLVQWGIVMVPDKKVYEEEILDALKSSAPAPVVSEEA